MTVWLVLPLVCLWWYQGGLDELKREAIAVTAPSGGDPFATDPRLSRDRFLDS